MGNQEEEKDLLAKAECESNYVSLNIEETMAVLTRCSFDEGHRQPIFLLGGIPAIAELIKVGSLYFDFGKSSKSVCFAGRKRGSRESGRLR